MFPQYLLCSDPRVAASVLLADTNQISEAELLQLVPRDSHDQVEAELVHVKVELHPGDIPHLRCYLGTLRIKLKLNLGSLKRQIFCQDEAL